MIEPVPTTALDSFLGVSMLFLAYIGISITISVVLQYHILPITVSSMLVFLTVAAFLLVPFWSLFKKYYPEPPEID